MMDRPPYDMVKQANLFVMGEAPGNYPSYDPELHALFPHPPRCSGDRLKNLMGMSTGEYVRLHRRNLLDYWPGKTGKGARFPARVAKEAVAALHADHVLVGKNVLLVGRRLSHAFGYGDVPFLDWQHMKAYNYAVLPHTSGINLWWNDKDNRARGTAFLESVAAQARAGASCFVNPGAD